MGEFHTNSFNTTQRNQTNTAAALCLNLILKKSRKLLQVISKANRSLAAYNCTCKNVTQRAR